LFEPAGERERLRGVATRVISPPDGLPSRYVIASDEGRDGGWHPETVTAQIWLRGAALAVLLLGVGGCDPGLPAGVSTPSPDRTESIRQAFNSSDLGQCLTENGFPSSGSGFYDTRTDLTDGPDYEWVGGVSSADGSGHEVTVTYSIAAGAFIIDDKPYWDDEKAAITACRKASGRPASPIPNP
jgi:hypothetical protein